MLSAKEIDGENRYGVFLGWLEGDFDFKWLGGCVASLTSN
jgi:hypothetical protein